MYEVKTTKSFQAATEALIEKLKEREFGVLYQVNFKEKIKSKGLDFPTNFEVLEVWNGNSFFDKFYKVQNFFPYAIPIVLDNEPPRM
ncbi:DUF302 domain-containing protein [Enterococcus faecium]|uniref:DUF302 domain-containing protein n=2 Tax=Enterococcus TaxID=1350 RepID=UPI00201BE58B|nr:DUF302 domain-containing protein [Enterococcus faecium]